MDSVSNNNIGYAAIHAKFTFTIHNRLLLTLILFTCLFTSKCTYHIILNDS